MGKGNDGNTVGETNSPETEAVIKSLGPDYNTIHKDTQKERKRKLTQTSDHNIIHVKEEKSERISCIKDVFTKENLYEKLPITQWLPKYDISCVVSDMIAGITVGLTVIPQGIAYAGVAGLPAQYGLYSAFMGCFVYMIFGSSKDVTVGPTAIMSILTAQYAALGVEYAILLAFICGVMISLFGILRLGFVIDFISVPVIGGFTSAASITIASKQLSKVFGIDKKHRDFVNETAFPEFLEDGVFKVWGDVFYNWDTLRLNDTILGVCCVILLLAMRELKNITWFDDKENKPKTKCQIWCGGLSPTVRTVLAKTIWLTSVGRNAIVVILTALIAYGCDPDLPDEEGSIKNTTFILTGNLEGGIPTIQIPPFCVKDENGDCTETFGDMLSNLGAAIIILPLMAVLENIAIAKAFAKGKQIDANQEMIALGACNLAGSFVQSFPTTGSFSRTAVNSASGVKTPAGGIYTGGLVLLALAFLMPLCAYIPEASLGALIITAVIFSVEFELILPIWRSKRIDLIPFMVTFLCCLVWKLEYGIIVGAGVQCVFICYNSARPNIRIETYKDSSNVDYLWITPDRALVYSSVNYVRTVIGRKIDESTDNYSAVVIDCSQITSVDFTTVKGLKAVVDEFKFHEKPVLFYNPNPSSTHTFEGACPKDIVIVNALDHLGQYV